MTKDEIEKGLSQVYIQAVKEILDELNIPEELVSHTRYLPLNSTLAEEALPLDHQTDFLPSSHRVPFCLAVLSIAYDNDKKERRIYLYIIPKKLISIQLVWEDVAQTQEDPDIPRYMMIGDTISVGKYVDFIQDFIIGLEPTTLFTTYTDDVELELDIYKDIPQASVELFISSLSINDHMSLEHLRHTLSRYNINEQTH